MKSLRIILIGFVLSTMLIACKDNSLQSTWVLNSNFVQPGIAVKDSMQVWVYVFDEQGQTLVSEQYALNDTNLNTWQDDVTKLLNQGENAKYIRARIDPNNIIQTKTNYVWLSDPKHTFVMGFRR